MLACAAVVVSVQVIVQGTAGFMRTKFKTCTTLEARQPPDSRTVGCVGLCCNVMDGQIGTRCSVVAVGVVAVARCRQ